MAIREHCRANSKDNRVPSEIVHLVSSGFMWYEIVSYDNSMDSTDLRFFEKVNSHWVEVLQYAGCGGDKGIVIKKLPSGSGGGIVSGGVKRWAQMYINANAQMLSDGMGISLQPKELFDYDSSGEKVGSDIVKTSAVAAGSIAIATGIISRGKSFIKDPDSLKTIGMGFKGRTRKNIFNMADIPVKKILYKKRSAVETETLRKEFNSTKRGGFAKSLVDSPDKIKKLKNSGFTDEDILRLKNKKLPEGYQVHHKLPIDDSGTNDPSNFILIKNDPYHKTITNYQNSFAKGMKDGDIVEIEFPVPKGNIYPLIKG